MSMEKTNEELVKEIQQGRDVPGNLGALYEQNRPLIEKAVRRIYSNYHDIQDGQQDAFIGLSIAADKYREEQGYKFTTYLTAVIKGYLLREKYRAENHAGVSFRDNQTIRQYRKLVSDFQKENGKKPTGKEVCLLMGLSTRAYRRMIEAERFLSIQSIDAAAAADEDGDSIPLADLLQSGVDVEAEILDGVEREEIRAALSDAMQALTLEERTVVQQLYLYGATIEDSGRACGLSATRARTRRDSALHKMRRSPRLQRCATAAGYGSSAYHGSLTAYKYNLISVTEREALRAIARERHEDYNEYY